MSDSAMHDDTRDINPDAEIVELQKVIKALEESLKACKEAQQSAEKKAEDSHLRGLAEIENMRRRTQLDIENARKYSIERLARELLLVIDSLQQALAVESTDSSLKQGVELTLKLLLDVLDKFGIQEIDPLGKAFDPTQHEAISLQPTDNIEEANTVLMVAQTGFTLKDRILRPARVVVAQAQVTQMAEAGADNKHNTDEDLV